MGWYEDVIEPGIRDQVHLLRDNGINTTCSCEHEMYVEVDCLVSDEVDRIHMLLTDHGYWNFTIQMSLTQESGTYVRRKLCVYFHKDESEPD